MPQLTAFGPTPAVRLNVSMQGDPLRPDAPLVVTISTYGQHSVLQRQQDFPLQGCAADFTPTLVEAAVQGYLFGDSWVDTFLAARRVKTAADRHRRDQERSGRAL